MSTEGRRQEGISRRDFFQSAAVAGAGLVLSRAAFGQTEEALPDQYDLKVAMLGVGSQGRALMINALKVPGIRFAAVCDIWPYHQVYASNILKKYKHQANVYTDYQEMLEKEQGLDAVIIATPDWTHSEHTVACLKAGVNVYCEKEMSNTLDKAKEMVLAARESGKLLQIGHQRRSNPRYLHALKMIYNDKILGRITNVYGQWNRAVRENLGWPKGKELEQAALDKYGYESMERFRNWRWFRKFSGGPISDLGSHQVDIFNWFLETPPKAVMASGGLDYYENREWYDNVMAIYEYPTGSGTVRGMYQVLNTTSHGGFYETFMGDQGSLVISEDERKGFVFREMAAKRREWEDEASKVEAMGAQAIELKIGESLNPDGTQTKEAEQLAAEAKKPTLQLHLENFFNAIVNGTPLSCSGEVGYETAVSVLRVNESIEAGKRLEYTPADFKA